MQITKKINKPTAFKTSEIAIAKEELGIPVKKAVNRLGKERIVKPNPFHLKYLKKAIEELKETGKNNPTYREIREKAFELYKKENDKKAILEKYRGIFRLNMPKDEAIEIIEDKGLMYEL